MRANALVSRRASGLSSSTSKHARNRRRRCDAPLRSTDADAFEIPFGDTAGAVVTLSDDIRVTTGDNDLILGTHDGNAIRIEPGEICGVVGANGSGKSTLVKVLSGTRGASDGSARVGTRLVGVLEQVGVSGSTKTVEEEAFSRMSHVREAESAREDALREMELGLDGAAERLANANARYEAVGGGTAAKRVASTLKGLGFSDDMMRAPCDTLSGGWQMRVALARLLLSPAGDSKDKGVNGGLLLLDEPSNHLDSKSKMWLADWIKNFVGTVVLVSHDEELLACVNRVVEIRSRKLHNFKGDYTRFLKEREATNVAILFTISARRRVATSIASARRRLTIDVSTFLGSGDWCRHARASLLRRDRAFRARGTSRNDEERRVVMRFATATRGSIENAPARGSIGGAMMR